MQSTVQANLLVPHLTLEVATVINPTVGTRKWPKVAQLVCVRAGLGRRSLRSGCRVQIIITRLCILTHLCFLTEIKSDQHFNNQSPNSCENQNVRKREGRKTLVQTETCTHYAVLYNKILLRFKIQHTLLSAINYRTEQEKIAT